MNVLAQGEVFPRLGATYPDLPKPEDADYKDVMRVLASNLLKSTHALFARKRLLPEAELSSPGEALELLDAAVKQLGLRSLKQFDEAHFSALARLA